jgi:uncharacterized membrane protein (DUF2068 family)
MLRRMADRDGSLVPLIVVFKAFKTATLTAVGVALFATRKTDPVGSLIQFALAVHLPLSSELFGRALNFATHLTVGKQTALALTAFGYAALMGAEGVGLYLRKRWARWFTIVATSSLIPIEVYEIVRKIHLVRIIILVVNAAVVVYLYRRKEVFEER